MILQEICHEHPQNSQFAHKRWWLEGKPFFLKWSLFREHASFLGGNKILLNTLQKHVFFKGGWLSSTKRRDRNHRKISSKWKKSDKIGFNLINFDVHFKEYGREDTVSNLWINYIADIGPVHVQIYSGYLGMNIFVELKIPINIRFKRNKVLPVTSHPEVNRQFAYLSSHGCFPSCWSWEWVWFGM